MQKIIEQAILLATSVEFEKLARKKSKLEQIQQTEAHILLTYRQVGYRVLARPNQNGSVDATLYRHAGLHIWNRNFWLDDETVFQQIADKCHSAATHDSNVAVRLKKLESEIQAACRHVSDWFTDAEVRVLPIIRDKEMVSRTVTIMPQRANLVGARSMTIKIEGTTPRQIRLSHDYQRFDSGIDTAKELTAWTDFKEVLQSYCRRLDRKIQRHLDHLTCPIEAVSLSPDARQAILVLVPVRLAEYAKAHNQTDWYSELARCCLEKLGRQKKTSNRMVREAFFQLLLALLAPPGSAAQGWDQFDRIGRELADLRRSDGSVPFNPVLGYQTWLSDAKEVRNRISKEEASQLNWFLAEAHLEQMVEVMGLL